MCHKTKSQLQKYYYRSLWTKAMKKEWKKERKNWKKNVPSKYGGIGGRWKIEFNGKNAVGRNVRAPKTSFRSFIIKFRTEKFRWLVRFVIITRARWQISRPLRPVSFPHRIVVSARPSTRTVRTHTHTQVTDGGEAGQGGRMKKCVPTADKRWKSHRYSRTIRSLRCAGEWNWIKWIKYKRHKNWNE